MGTRQDLNTAHLVLNFRESSSSIQHPVPKKCCGQLPGENALIGLPSALGLGANQIKRAIRPQSLKNGRSSMTQWQHLAPIPLQTLS